MQLCDPQATVIGQAGTTCEFKIGNFLS